MSRSIGYHQVYTLVLICAIDYQHAANLSFDLPRYQVHVEEHQAATGTETFDLHQSKLWQTVQVLPGQKRDHAESAAGGFEYVDWRAEFEKSSQDLHQSVVRKWQSAADSGV